MLQCGDVRIELESLHIVFQNNLPHLINPIESKLGTSTTNDINLIIYLMEEKYSPLKIRTTDGRMKEIASFLSPQFGSVLLYDTRLSSLQGLYYVPLSIVYCVLTFSQFIMKLLQLVVVAVRPLES